ncbi:unnamed protein product [Symbiodinium natans]|uniref:Uncharacterized protein n=1 Tax=Symbiodinium natans TaxID=878477 RepID=A0A812P7G7_9DINO|nr:unnamed protein product [Symbiodinium natans]
MSGWQSHWNAFGALLYNGSMQDPTSHEEYVNAGFTTVADAPRRRKELEIPGRPCWEDGCAKCLASASMGRCSACAAVEECSCMCSSFFQKESFAPVAPEEREIHVSAAAKHFIPRVVHQVWISDEALEGDPKKHRGILKLLERNRQLGNHTLYDGTAARQFIQQRFPSSVLDAFDLLVPGKFKSDLARLCLLLVEGGVYVDNDILLTTSLDELLGGHTGFLATLDRFANRGANQTCLLNGLIAAAPGHPAIAIALARLVAHVLNQDTFADLLGDFSDPPVWHMVTSSDLWATGPCLLGSSLNLALARDPFAGFEPGTWSFDARSSASGGIRFGQVRLLDLRPVEPASRGMEFGVEVDPARIRPLAPEKCRAHHCHHARYDVDGDRYVGFSKFLQTTEVPSWLNASIGHLDWDGWRWGRSEMFTRPNRPRARRQMQMTVVYPSAVLSISSNGTITYQHYQHMSAWVHKCGRRAQALYFIPLQGGETAWAEGEVEEAPEEDLSLLDASAEGFEPEDGAAEEDLASLEAADGLEEVAEEDLAALEAAALDSFEAPADEGPPVEAAPGFEASEVADAEEEEDLAALEAAACASFEEGPEDAEAAGRCPLADATSEFPQAQDPGNGSFCRAFA